MFRGRTSWPCADRKGVQAVLPKVLEKAYFEPVYCGMPNANPMEVKRRCMRRGEGALAPEERLAHFARLQARALALLESSPTGRRAFLRRNYRKRRDSASLQDAN